MLSDDEAKIIAAQRWRLVLGHHADEALPIAEPDDEDRGDGESRAMDRTLRFLYDREFAERGHQRAGMAKDDLKVPAWLSGVRVLFPREAVQVIERDALARYGLTELVTDPEVLESLDRNADLVRCILQFKHLMAPAVLERARSIVREVVEAMAEALRTETRAVLHGTSSAQRSGAPRSFRNTDWTRTIRRNLKHYDRDEERLVADRIEFRHRQRRRLPWRIVVAVDQSGSMTDSLIHAAIASAILASLPAVTVDLLLWDHRVVDVSDHVDDPLAVLMGAQLGGGTSLVSALAACAERVTDPERTIVAVVSDWYVYDDVPRSLTIARELAEAGVKGLGLCAIDADGRADFDETVARRLAATGWWVGAVTPKHFVEQIAHFLAG
ncbi:MAG: VWA domain-containing protein [Myxococcota bacterium]